MKAFKGLFRSHSLSSNSTPCLYCGKRLNPRQPGPYCNDNCERWHDWACLNNPQKSSRGSSRSQSHKGQESYSSSPSPSPTPFEQYDAHIFPTRSRTQSSAPSHTSRHKTGQLRPLARKRSTSELLPRAAASPSFTSLPPTPPLVRRSSAGHTPGTALKVRRIPDDASLSRPRPSPTDYLPPYLGLGHGPPPYRTYPDAPDGLSPVPRQPSSPTRSPSHSPSLLRYALHDRKYLPSPDASPALSLGNSMHRHNRSASDLSLHAPRAHLSSSPEPLPLPLPPPEPTPVPPVAGQRTNSLGLRVGPLPLFLNRPLQRPMPTRPGPKRSATAPLGQASPWEPPPPPSNQKPHPHPRYKDNMLRLRPGYQYRCRGPRPRSNSFGGFQYAAAAC